MGATTPMQDPAMTPPASDQAAMGAPAAEQGAMAADQAGMNASTAARSRRSSSRELAPIRFSKPSSWR